MFVSLFSKMKRSIHSKVTNRESGLYISILFPIMVAFVLTFIGTRLVSMFAPQFYILEADGVRVHHFTYGIFILAVSGYLALVFNGPRAIFFIALLHGFGLGLAFDELGMWLKLRDDDIARWSYDGFNIIIGLFFVILAAKPGIKLIRGIFWPKNGLN